MSNDIVTLKNKKTGEVVKLRRKTSQATQEQPQEQPQITQNPPEQRIQGRPSAMADLMQDPSTLSRLKEHPLGTILRTMGGAAELMQGVPASIGLDLQQGQYKDILPNVGKVFTGQRPAQYGDVFKGAGLPEPLAAGAGLYTDVMTTPGGAEATVGLGKLAKSGFKALKGILKFDNALKQATRSKQALDATRTMLGKAKEIAMQEVKDLPVEFNWKDIPQKALNILKNPDSKVLFDSEGKIVNTMSNLDRVKVLLQDMPTQKDFVEAGKLATGDIIRYSGKVRDAMVNTANKAGRPELGKALSDFHNFKNNYNIINDKLVDKYGNALANKLKSTFKWNAEPLVKEAWKEVGKTSPEIKSVMNSMNRREMLKNLLKITGVTTGIGLAGKGAKSLISGE